MIMDDIKNIWAKSGKHEHFFIVETADQYRIREAVKWVDGHKFQYDNNLLKINAAGEKGRDTVFSVNSMRYAVIYGIYRRQDDLFEYLASIHAGESRACFHVVFVPSRDLVPPSVLKQARLIVPPISTPGERLKVMSENAPGVKITDEMIRLARGIPLAELEAAVRTCVADKGTIDPRMFRDIKIQILQKYGLKYIEPKINFEHVGGMGFLKDYIKKHVVEFFKHPDIADMFGLTAPRGILMAGIGGTGKSWFSTALAGELAMPVVQMNISDILASGNAEVELRHVLKVIDALSPLVIFMDEIDQLAMKREQVTDPVRRGLINVLMEWLGNSEKKAFVVGATNLIHQIDENFLRSGRFDAIVYVSPPTLEERKEILEIHAFKVRKTKGVGVDCDALSAIAEKTELWVGSDLESLVQKAYELAMIDYMETGEKKVTAEHFERAYEAVQPNMSLRKSMISETVRGMKMLPQGAVVKETYATAEVMVNIGKKRKAERRGEQI